MLVLKRSSMRICANVAALHVMEMLQMDKQCMIEVDVGFPADRISSLKQRFQTDWMRMKSGVPALDDEGRWGSFS